jgi:hypothetical protein
MNPIILNVEMLVYRDNYKYQDEQAKGVLEVNHFGIQSKLGYAAGHLILVGNREECELIDGRYFSVVTNDWDEAVRLMSQVSPAEIEAYQIVMQGRRDYLHEEVIHPETILDNIN